MPRAGADFSGKVYKKGDLECKAGIQLIRKQVILYRLSTPLPASAPSASGRVQGGLICKSFAGSKGLKTSFCFTGTVLILLVKDETKYQPNNFSRRP